jgi:phosphoribosyl-ATP pyrophosphohydrolase
MQRCRSRFVARATRDLAWRAGLPHSLTHSRPVGVILTGMSDSLDRLYQAVLAARTADPASSRTARLLRAGRSKMAKKLAEEAVEVVIDAMHGHSDALVRESADLLYNLVVLWVASSVHPKDVWTEMERRERLLGIAEKLPKERSDASPRRKVVALDRSRVRKRR